MGIDHSSQGILTVDLLPEPDMGTELENADNVVRDGADCDVVVDFSNVDIITSSSLSALLVLRQSLVDCGHRLIFCSINTFTKSAFKVTGLDGVFELADDKSAASAELQRVN